MICSAVSIQYQNVTDSQIDRQTDRQTEQNSYIKIAITKEERLNHYTRNALLLLIHQAFVNTKKM